MKTTKSKIKRGKQTKPKASNGKPRSDKREKSDAVKDGFIDPRDYVGMDMDEVEALETKDEYPLENEDNTRPASVDEEAFINKLFGPTPERGPYRNAFLVVNVWGLEGRRDVKYTIDDDLIEVGGTFYNEKKSAYIRHVFPLLRTGHKKIATTNCGSLFLVRGSCDLGDLAGPLDCEPGSFLWNRVMSVANSLSFVSSKVGLDLAYLENQLSLKVSKIFPSCPEVQLVVHNVVLSNEFLDLRTKALNAMLGLREQAKANKLMELKLNSEPLDFSLVNLKLQDQLMLVAMFLLGVTMVNAGWGQLLPPLVGMHILWLWWSWDEYHHVRNDHQPVFKFANLIRAERLCRTADTKLNEGANLEFEHFKECPRQTIDIYGCVVPGAKFVVPKTCQCNLISALKIRYLFDRSYDVPTVNRFTKFAKSWMRDNVGLINEPVPTIAEWGRTRYTNKRVGELESARLRPVTKATLASKPFVKDETYVAKDADSFKPRLIQARHDEVLSRVGPLFYMISKFFVALFSITSMYFYTSGASASELAAYAEGLYAKGHVYEMDVSNWDGSMGPFILSLELWFVRNIVMIDCFSLYGDRDELEKILHSWVKVWGSKVTKFARVVYSCGWGRRSGDAWTSVFNTMFNFIFVAFVCSELGVDLVGMMALGDDNVVAFSHVVDVDKIVAIYAKLGMKLVCRKPEFHDLEYCSGRFWNIGPHAKWGVKPGKVLSKFGFNYKKHPTKVHKQLLHGTCVSLLPIAGHIPVLGALLRAVSDSARDQGIKVRYGDGNDNPHKTKSSTVDWPSIDTYVQFCRIYGLDLGDVLELEERIECTFSIDSFPCELVDPIFRRMVEVDGAVGEGNNYEVVEPTKVPSEFDYAILSPLLEEVYRWVVLSVFGVWGFVLAGLVPFLETKALFKVYGRVMWYNIVVHSLLTLGTLCLGFTPTLVIHYLLNFYMEGNLNLYEITMTKSNKKNRKQTTMPKTNIQGKLDKYIIANLAPFSPAALGAKVPDNQMLPSVPIAIKASTNIVADANGYGAAVYRPFPSDYEATPYAISSLGVITWHNANVVSTNDTAMTLPSETALLRVVGGGIRLTYESKMDDVSGSVHVAAGADLLADPSDAVQYGALWWPVDKNEMQRTSTHHDIQVSELVRQGGVELPFLKLDSTQDQYKRAARIYAPLTSNDLGFDQNHTTGSSYWCVYLEGMVPGTIVEVDYVVHLEIIISPSHPSYLSQTPAKPMKAILLDTVQAVHQNITRPKSVKKSDHTSVGTHLKELGIAALSIGKDFAVSKGAQYAAETVLPFLEEAGFALLAGLL